jgi:virginiamycin A acetyltransferase
MKRKCASIRVVLKAVANGVALVLISPCALTCWAESRLVPRGESVFGFWTNLMALLPGSPGMYLRRAFYRLTVESCSLDCFIGFGTLFTHRSVTVEDGAYIGNYSLIGSAKLRRGCLVGSRVSILSGSSLHALNAEGRWEAADLARLRQIEIGENAWIGEGAVVMVNVGAGSLVGAGALVSTRVRPGVVVAGNPARVLRQLGTPPASSRVGEADG